MHLLALHVQRIMWPRCTSLNGGVGMPTVHKGYRLDTELVAQIAAWAEEHKTTEAEAVRTLLAQALAADSQEGKDAPQADAETRAMLGEHIKDLRATVSTLNAEVSNLKAEAAEKDQRLYALSERLADIADHAQFLAAKERQRLPETTQAVAVSQDVEQQDTQRKGWLAMITRWFTGGEV